MYGIPPTKLQADIHGLTQNQAIDEVLQARWKILALLKYNLLAAQEIMKVQYDKHRTEREFTVGIGSLP